MEPQYRILEQTTIGWVDYDPNAPNMDKEDCQQLYKSLVGDGINPRDLKIKRVV
tara:strand:- start:152 stop:313 length:162 start_codon:yes stop_codon:yes gene_type:complete